VNLGGLMAARGEFEEARKLYMKGLDGTVQVGEAYLEGVCRDDLAVTLMELGELDEAERQLSAALPLLNAKADRIAIVYREISLGRLRLLQGRSEEAKPLLQHALDTHREFDNLYGVGSALEWLARAALAEGDLDRAEALVEESSQARNRIGDSLGVAHLHQLRADMAAKRGDETVAQSHRTEAARLFRSCGCDRLADALA